SSGSCRRSARAAHRTPKCLVASASSGSCRRSARAAHRTPSFHGRTDHEGGRCRSRSRAFACWRSRWGPSCLPRSPGWRAGVARVIRVERPTGDRIGGLVWSGVGKTDGITYTWENFNRGKRGIVLDLAQPTAKEIVYELAKTADVFLTSLLPPARRKLGV